MKSTDSQAILKLFTRLKYLLAIMQWLCIFSGVGMIYQAFHTHRFQDLLLAAVFFYLCWQFFTLGRLFMLEVLVKQHKEFYTLKEIWRDIRKNNMLRSALYFKMQARKLIK
jgi:hypothetical protein